MEERAADKKKTGICISGKSKDGCACFNCFRNWKKSESRHLSSSQPCKSSSSRIDNNEPSKKKAKLYNSDSEDYTKLQATKFTVKKLGSGEVGMKLAAGNVCGLSKNKAPAEYPCSSVIEVYDSSSSVSSDSDIIVSDIASTESDVQVEEDKVKEETTFIDSITGKSGENTCLGVMDSTEDFADSEVLFNYSQEDAIILISDDDNDEEVGEVDDDDDDDDDGGGGGGKDANIVGFINANTVFYEKDSKFYSREIKKEIPDSATDSDRVVSTKQRGEGAEEPSRNFEKNGKVNSLNFDVPTLKLEANSANKGTEALQHCEKTEVYCQSDIKEEKPDPEKLMVPFEGVEESRKETSSIAQDRQTNVCVKKETTSSGHHVKSPIFSSTSKSLWKRYSSSSDDDDDDDGDNKRCFPSNSLHVLPKINKTINQWLTKQDNNTKLLPKRSASKDFDDDDDDDDELYMCATQVEENLFEEDKVNEKVSNKNSPQISGRLELSRKTLKSSTTTELANCSSSKNAEDSKDCSKTNTSRGSLTNVAHTILSNMNTSKVSLSKLISKDKYKAKNEISKCSWKIDYDDDSDSDSSMFSMATQVDRAVPLVIDIDGDINNNKNSDDDELYILNTQVDSVPRKRSFKFKSKLISSSSETKRSINNTNEDSDSDDSLFSIATQVDPNTIPKSKHQIKKNCSLFPKVSSFVTNSRQVSKTEVGEFKTPKFPHRKKISQISSSSMAAKNTHYCRRGTKLTEESDEESEEYFMPTLKNNKTLTNTSKSVHRSNVSYKGADEDYDSDSSVFSVATQLDVSVSYQNVEEKDEPYFQATQVDKHQSNFNGKTKFPSPKGNSFKIPLQPLKKLSKTSSRTLDIPHCKERHEDYDSDDSMFSIATQVDDPCPLKIIEEDDIFIKATQVDETFTSKSSRSPVFHPKIKASKRDSASSTSNPKVTDNNNSDNALFLAATQVDAVDLCKEDTENADSLFSGFLLDIAATESSGIDTANSTKRHEPVECMGKKKEEEEEEHKSDAGFADFLLGLGKDSDKDELVSAKPPQQNAKVSEIAPQKLKSRKEMRENFKLQQTKLDNKTKLSCTSPEKPPAKIFSPVKLSIEEPNLPKKKKPLLKKVKLSTDKVIAEGISSAKNQLEERFLFMSLDKTPAKWTKSSCITVGSSSLISDVTLPHADEIKKLRLPLMEPPKRHKPLPETLIKNHPKESQEITRTLSPVLDPVVSGTTSQNQPTSPTSVNNQKTSCIISSSSSSSSTTTSQSKQPPHSPPQLPKPIPLFENSNKCFAKDFNSFHIPKIKNSCQKTKPDPTQTTNVSLLQDRSDSSNHKQTVYSEGPKSTPSYPKSSFSSHSIINTRQQPTSSVNPTRRVTFSNVNKPIDILQPQWRRPSQQTHGDLLKYLLRWNTKWLKEQIKLQKAPPVIAGEQLYPLIQSYSSYTDYVNVIRPLFLLEVWESVYKEYAENMSTIRDWQVACCNVTKAGSSQMDYVVYGLISETDCIANNCMMEEDFVILKLQVTDSWNQSSNGNHGNTSTSNEYPVFGFVAKVNLYRRQEHIEILERFPDLAALSRTMSNFKIFRAIIKCHYRKLTHCFANLIRIQPISSLIPFVRQYQALMKFVLNPLHPHLLNPAEGAAVVTVSAITVKGNYNISQKKAISAVAEMACQSQSKPYYCLVQGPPGTGKSHTIIGMIQKVKEQKPCSKILLCAPSNGAVDELMRRLIDDRQKAQAESRVPLKFVRIGNPKHIHKDVIKYSLNKLISVNLKSNAVKDSMSVEIQKYKSEQLRNDDEIIRMFSQPKSFLREEKKIIQNLEEFSKISPHVNTTIDSTYQANEGDLYMIRKLRKDQRYVKDKIDLLTRQLESNQALSNIESSPSMEAHARRCLLSKADVICGTLSTCGSNRFLTELGDERFSCIIIDEASQCCELDSLIPLQYNCCKLVLIGDVEQLSPIIISQHASEYNYGQSLFERLCKHFKYKDKSFVIMLNVQYRMHPDICKFPNRYIYDSLLTSCSELEARSSTIPLVPYLLFDAQFGSHVRSADSGSLSNPMEARFIVCLCACLSNKKVVKSSLKIAVIAAYKQQKKLLENLLAQRRLVNVDVTTVDGFQGRENDIIILSCVRAHSSYGNIGFLKNRRRLNVALTRAKFALYIVGHLSSLEGDEDWKSLIQDAYDRHLVVRIGCPDQFESVVKKCMKV